MGAGVGGLAAALRLRAAGHGVTLCEAGDRVGGKLAARTVDGFTWDTGPSLLTLPSVFDDLLRTAGTTLADEVDLVRLDPAVRYLWPDGATLDARDGLDATLDEVERLAPGQATAMVRFLAGGARAWEVSARTFLAGPLERPAQLLRRMRGPGDVAAIDPLRTLHGRARRTFDDPRLVQWAGRYATYSGSAPRRAPATLACIPWIEQRHGSWHVRGGLARLADALGRLAAARGVDVRTGADVAAVVAPGDGPVRGVRLADGTTVPADVVVADVDADHLYADLLPDEGALRRVRRAPRSSSGVALLLGVEGRTPGLAHHTVAFPADPDAEFAAVFGRGEAPDDPTIYVCCPAATDATLAPAGDESWFVLVNVPAGWDGDAGAYGDRVLDRLAGHGLDVRPRIRVRRTITPADLEARYRDPGGAIYGTSSNGRRAAFLRPANRGTRRGLYLVGGSSHPGGGLPLVALSGAIVAGMVAADGW